MKQKNKRTSHTIIDLQDLHAASMLSYMSDVNRKTDELLKQEAEQANQQNYL